MSDIDNKIAELEAKLAEAQLIANLSTDPQVRARHDGIALELEERLKALRVRDADAA